MGSIQRKHQSRRLGYDSFDRGDWDNHLVITKD